MLRGVRRGGHGGGNRIGWGTCAGSGARFGQRLSYCFGRSTGIRLSESMGRHRATWRPGGRSMSLHNIGVVWRGYVRGGEERQGLRRGGESSRNLGRIGRVEKPRIRTDGHGSGEGLTRGGCALRRYDATEEWYEQEVPERTEGLRRIPAYAYGYSGRPRAGDHGR